MPDIIREANLTIATMWSVNREQLLNTPLTQFVAPQDQEVFHQFCRRLFDTRIRQTCELSTVKPDHTKVDVV